MLGTGVGAADVGDTDVVVGEEGLACEQPAIATTRAAALTAMINLGRHMLVPSSSLVFVVNLTRIYTKAGDDGDTRLADNSVVEKTHTRIGACGSVDEALSAIGVAMAAGLPGDVLEVLTVVQNELFDVGADLSTPGGGNIAPASVTRLEAWCDQFNADLPVARSFVLPGGAGAHLHLARTVVRRAERSAWAAADEAGLTSDGAIASMTGINHDALRYLNRLSDLLFILARHVNQVSGVPETLWQPSE